MLVVYGMYAKLLAFMLSEQYCHDMSCVSSVLITKASRRLGFEGLYLLIMAKIIKGLLLFLLGGSAPN